MKKTTKKSFITIEVLISIVIVFISIVTLTSAIKLNNNFENKKELYNSLYITVRSIQNRLKSLNRSTLENNLKDKLYNKNLSSLDLGIEQLNGFTIAINYKKIKELRSFQFDEFTGGSNNGPFINTLYQFNLTVARVNFEKTYSFYLNKTEDTR